MINVNHATHTHMLSFCSTLTEALDRCKRKYQAKLRKTEQQMIAVMRGSEAKIREAEDPLSGKNIKIREAEGPLSGKNMKSIISSRSVDQQPKTSSSKIPLPRLEGKAL